LQFSQIPDLFGDPDLIKETKQHYEELRKTFAQTFKVVQSAK